MSYSLESSFSKISVKFSKSYSGSAKAEAEREEYVTVELCDKPMVK